MAKRRIFSTALALVLLLNSLTLSLSPHPAVASPDEAKWSRVSIPTEGKPGDWVLASGSSVSYLTMAIDGTLYCYANPSATEYRLFKSTDDGSGWSYTGEIEDAIVGIAAAPNDASIIYYATTSNVYKSTDAGDSFTTLPANPGGAGSNGVEITSLDVALLDGGTMVGVSTRDTDATEYGGVYTLDESTPGAVWANTNIGDYDVLSVAFSPNFTTDGQLVAVATDEADAIVTSKIGDAGWGDTIGDATIAGVVPVSVAIAFPDDYDIDAASCILFVGIDTGTGNGDVYQVDRVWAPGNSVATDLDIGSAYALNDVDVTTLVVTGNTTDANLLAGAASSAQVYISTDGGTSWTRSSKEPTGESKTYVLMAADFLSSGRAYAATSGTESAFSYTSDGSVTWNQASLIDTEISTIVDVAVSPRYWRDDTLFMLTFDGEHSLWQSLDSGTTWERVFTSTLPNVDTLKLVELSPEYEDSNQVVFLAGVSSGNPTIWKSTDNGQTFTPQNTPLTINTWAVVDDDTLFIGGYDGSNGLVYRTTDSGLSYSTGATAGNKSLSSIALSADYEDDETILVGNTTGEVYWSNDNGTIFEALGQQLALSGGLGEVTVAFDPEFSSNKIVYAASDAEATADNKERIYRFIIGNSNNWESIDGTLPEDAMIEQLVVSADGALYAVNSDADGGMQRSLNPAYPLNPTFETVTRGLDDGITLSGLWTSKNQLWSIDTNNVSLMTYIDSLSRPVVLRSPDNKAPGIDINNVILNWASLKGATEYTWQLDYETNFSTVPEGFEDNTGATSARLSTLELATKYYWRVRATKPVVSPWSAKWSFTTILGGTTVAPELLSPKAGADGELLKPVFQWSAIAGADRYELLVSSDISFIDRSIEKINAQALPATAWQSDISLDYNTTYYWKVRARNPNSYSIWSAVGAFTIQSPPEPSPTPETPAPEPSLQPEPTTDSSPPEPPPEPSPELLPITESPPSEPEPSEAPLIQLNVPNWAIYLVVALLLTLVLLSVTMLALVVTTIRRS